MKVIFRYNILHFVWGNRPADCICLEHKKMWIEGANWDQGVCMECVSKAVAEMSSSNVPDALDRLQGNEAYDHLYRSNWGLELLSPSRQGRIHHIGYAEYGI